MLAWSDPLTHRLVGSSVLDICERVVVWENANGVELEDGHYEWMRVLMRVSAPLRPTRV